DIRNRGRSDALGSFESTERQPNVGCSASAVMIHGTLACIDIQCHRTSWLHGPSPAAAGSGQLHPVSSPEDIRAQFPDQRVTLLHPQDLLAARVNAMRTRPP